MFRRWRDRRLRPSLPVPSDAGAEALIDDAMECATQLQSIGDEIDAFRRRGGAALGGDPGPEVDILRDWQNEIMRRFLDRARAVKRDDPEALEEASRWIAERYRDTHGDLVTGRALELVEAVLNDGGP